MKKIVHFICGFIEMFVVVLHPDVRSTATLLRGRVAFGWCAMLGIEVVGSSKYAKGFVDLWIVALGEGFGILVGSWMDEWESARGGVR
jgi:hypothetical protein